MKILDYDRDFILDPFLALYLPLWRKDGASFMSDDQYGHLCTRIGALWRPNGPYFDGVDDYTRIADINLKQYTSKTILLWTKASGTVSTVYERVLSDETLTNDCNIVFVRHPSDNYVIAGTNDGSFQSQLATIFPADMWIFWAITLVSGDTLALYKNCSLVNSPVSIDDITGHGATHLDIGKPGFGAGSQYNGLVGELVIYSRDLTIAEIQNHYESAKWRYQ